MAALALLFAVYTYQRPPFLMLDEVDAHLDANNMYALATFMRSFECQTIVISLKEQVYTQCEGMVGISKNMARESSCAFTFDLEALRRELAGAGPRLADAPSPAAQRVLTSRLDTPLLSDPVSAPQEAARSLPARPA